jgi:hypothetical protein
MRHRHPMFLQAAMPRALRTSSRAGRRLKPRRRSIAPVFWRESPSASPHWRGQVAHSSALLVLLTSPRPTRLRSLVAKQSLAITFSPLYTQPATRVSTQRPHCEGQRVVWKRLCTTPKKQAPAWLPVILALSDRIAVWL